MKRSTLILTLVLATLTCIQSYRVISGTGLFYAINPHFSGQCEAVSGVVGAEDITIDHANQFAYISADDRRATLAGKPISGGIYGLDLSEPDALPTLLTQDFSPNFHPHGIYLYQHTDSSRSLFVVNHLEGGGENIEVFDINNVNQLTHRQSITYPELISPNDIVAIGPSQFYVTNDHGYPSGHFMQTLEEYLGLPLSSVSYYDGKKGHIVASGLKFTNGIAIAPDLKTLYIAEILNRKVGVYNRNANTNELSKRSDILVDTGADNLEWDENGNLWLGAHPKLFDFAAHAKDASKPSPSQVLKINVDKSTPEVEEIYLNAGEALSGSTVGAVSGNTLLIGSVFEEHLLKCAL